MGQAFVFGFGASSALVLGSLIGARFEMPERLLAAVLAFAAGALMSALSFELFQESFEKAGVLPAAIGLVARAASFASNFPEALVGARSMRENGRSARFAIVTWAICGLLLALSVVAGSAVLSGASQRRLP